MKMLIKMRILLVAGTTVGFMSHDCMGKCPDADAVENILKSSNGYSEFVGTLSDKFHVDTHFFGVSYKPTQLYEKNLKKGKNYAGKSLQEMRDEQDRVDEDEHSNPNIRVPYKNIKNLRVYYSNTDTRSNYEQWKADSIYMARHQIPEGCLYELGDSSKILNLVIKD